MHTHTQFSLLTQALSEGRGCCAAQCSHVQVRSSLQAEHTAEDQLPKDGPHAAEIRQNESMDVSLRHVRHVIENIYISPISLDFPLMKKVLRKKSQVSKVLLE